MKLKKRLFTKTLIFFGAEISIIFDLEILSTYIHDKI